MERIKLIATSIIAYLTLASSVDASEMLLCRVEKDSSSGWIPKSFFLRLPMEADYGDTRIILPKVHVMALAKWKKGWFAGANTYKFEGTVKEKVKKQLIPSSMFDSRYQMNIDQKTLKYEVFHTVITNGDWRSNNLQARGSCQKRPYPSGNMIPKLSKNDLCTFAITYEKRKGKFEPIWDQNYSEFVEEAKSRGNDCGTGDLAQSNVGQSNVPSQKSETDDKVETRKVESDLSFDGKVVLRIINYVLNGTEGVGIIGYTSTELRERRQSRVSPILIAGELCRVSTSDYRKDWTLDCPSGLVGAGIFSGVDANGAVTGSGQVGGEQFSFTHSRCSALIDCDTIKKTLLSNLRTTPAKQGKKEVIAADNQGPSIRITDSSLDGARGTISGIATDKSGIAEILVVGEKVPFDSSGRFTASTYVPDEGLDVTVEVIDLKGLSTTETIRLERSKRTQTVGRLAAVNPLVGPKQKPSRDRAALIIGLEQYAEAPPADYASRDAQMFADYAREKLGIAPGNIKVLTDTEATRSGLLRALKVWLPQAVQPDKTDLYVFYAGHGMASDDGESAYIVPYGADTFLLEDTAISRERFYEEIGAAKPRTATFFFDNCYAGTTRSEERLLAQRPLSIKVQESPVPDNYLVFTAGESNQTAGVLDEVKHGRFSYFVFKGLEGEADVNQDGKISAGELHTFVRESVGRFSAGAQTPTMLGDKGRWVLR
jgi:hypothetical protein